MSLSPNFFRYEFSCRCGKCSQDTVDAELINVLQAVRDQFGPVTITSGNRCPAHNKAVGGAPNSQHLYSRAADVVVADTEPKIVAEFVDTLMPNHGGIKWYSGWTHIDTRTTRWRGNDSPEKE